MLTASAIQPTSTPGVSHMGLITIKSNDALERERQERMAPPETPQVVSNLATYIKKCWSDAKQVKQPIEQQMLKNLRQRHGVYEPEQLAAIRHMGGSEVFMLLTSTLCRSAEAWIADTLRPVAERPWTLEATPVPELPPDLEMQIKEEVSQVFQEVVARAKQYGMMLNIYDIREELREFASKREEEIITELKQEGDRRAARMATVIDDQLVQGGWYDAFWQVISDLVTLKAGIIKGPVLRNKKVKKWMSPQSGGGRWGVAVTQDLVLEYDRVSPFDFYPAPGSCRVDDGYTLERIYLSRSDLNDMIGVPGYSEENIRNVLRDYTTGRREWLATDSERAMLEHGTTEVLTMNSNIEGLEFWGSVPGSMLIEWGMKGADIDPEMEYEANVILVGEYPVKAVLNPDKLGRKPYSMDSYERVPGSIWGKGVPELMADTQNVCNAVARALVNNAQIASGPLVEVNQDRCPGVNEIWPWRVIQSNNQLMTEQPAVNFYQPQVIVGPLQSVYEFFATQSENQTGIPRYAYGNMAVQGAGSTAGGLSMLMTQASRGIKEVITHIDKMTSGVIERTYDYNMLFHPDNSVKGDCRIVAKGSTSLLAKEQKLMRRNELLAATQNPIDVQLIGLENRQRLLIQQFREMDMEIDETGGLKDKVAQLTAQIQQQAAAEAMQLGNFAVPNAAPKTADASGMQQAGGVENNMFQNQPGVTP